MTAITVTLNGQDYPSYISAGDADLYLAPDAERGELWAGYSPDQKARGLISATRLIQRLSWPAGAVPATDDTTDIRLAQATALLAADILANPELSSSGSTSSNVKRAKGGSAEVEFFARVAGTPLPTASWDLLKSLLGGLWPTGISGQPYVSGSDVCSQFDSTDYRRNLPFR